VEVQALAMVGPDEVEGVALSEHVGAVAGDPVRGRPHRDPLAAEREPADHGAGWRAHRHLLRKRACLGCRNEHRGVLRGHAFRGTHLVPDETTRRAASRLLEMDYEHPSIRS
jgi:hypothetical protein